MIRAIVFDFDGLILDTELPEFQSWQEIYEAHGCTLSFAVWATCIGTVGAFDPYGYLEEQLRRSVDRTAVQTQQRQLRLADSTECRPSATLAERMGAPL